MNEEKKQVEEVVEFVERDFLINEDTSLIPAADTDSLEEFRKYLTEKLRLLLDEKFDLLVNILYRIDINEKKLGKLFSGQNREFIPSALADLIIERQLQKIKLRKLYREGKL